MSDVTRILAQIDAGDPRAAEQLLPLVYEELRQLARQKLAHERPGQTLQATALVHEAYLRLVGPVANALCGVSGARDSGLGAEGCATEGLPPAPSYNSRGHFFAAAAGAMRRILIESARRKLSVKHGGQRERADLDLDLIVAELPGADLLALDEALTVLAKRDAQAAKLVQLHCFAGLTIEQAAEVLGIPERTAYRDWSFARAWLHRELKEA